MKLDRILSYSSTELNAQFEKIPRPVKISYHLLITLMAFLFLFGERVEDVRKWFGLDRCHYRDPGTMARDGRFPERNCLSGRVTLIEWLDPTNYGDPNQAYDRRNRSLEVTTITSTGLVIWEERPLERTARSPEGEWVRAPVPAWYLVPGAEEVPAESLPIDGARGYGFILRRLELTEKESCGSERTAPSQYDNTFEVLEFFIEDRRDGVQYPAEDPGIFLRWVRLRCGEELGYSPRIGPTFERFGVKELFLRRD